MLNKICGLKQSFFVVMCLFLLSSCSYMSDVINSDDSDDGIVYSYKDTNQSGYELNNDENLASKDIRESEAEGLNADKVVAYDDNVVRRSDEEEANQEDMEKIEPHQVIEVKKDNIDNMSKKEVVAISNTIKEPKRPLMEEKGKKALLIDPKDNTVFVTDGSFVNNNKIESMKFDFSSNEKEVTLLEPKDTGYDLSGYFEEDNIPRSVSYVVATVYHPNGKTAFSHKYDKDLKKIINLVNNYGGKVKLVGHASSRTRNMDLASHNLLNLDISYKRAQSVADRLIEFGLSPQLIKITALADEDPIYAEIMPMGEAKNRRTEIFIEK